MDIGVIRRQNRCDYFVGEVERTVGLGIFDIHYVPVVAQHLGAMWLSPLQDINGTTM